MHAIPERFARTMVELHADEGVEWLRRLPNLIRDCEERWGLTVLAPFTPLSYNYVAPAIRADGTDAVLKVGFPADEPETQIPALRLYDGRGIVRLLEADQEQGAMLLERLTPGTPLAHIVDDEEATAIAADVMRQLWRPAPAEHPFPTVADWMGGMQRVREHFGGGSGPFPMALVAEAERLFADLIGSMGEPVLLHGDLHHENILAAQRQPWLAVDPKGVVGEPAYEVGALLRNRLPDDLNPVQTKRILARRIDQLAEALEFDRARLLGWGLAQAMLSAWWTVEDHGYGWEPTIMLAEYFAELSR